MFSKLDSKALLRLVLIGLVTGASAGLLSSAYRIAAREAQSISLFLYENAKQNWHYALLLSAVLLLSVFLTSILIKKEPLIFGSGIPQAKASVLKLIRYNPITVALSKFAGGFMMLVTGLSLGREGPSIQLGAACGEAVANKSARDDEERKMIVSAGAAAGVSAAFNAPLSGVVFAIEELYKKIPDSLVLILIVAAFTADFISKLIFGNGVTFEIKSPEPLGLEYYPIILIAALAAAIFGGLFNKIIELFQTFYKKLNFIPHHFKPAVAVAVAVFAGFFVPQILGGGHELAMDAFSLHTPLFACGIYFILKLIFTGVCFSSGAPGGIFLPMLSMGALVGGALAQLFMLCGLPQTVAFWLPVVAMGAFLSSAVRAPLTAVALTLELTGGFTGLLPVILAVISADIFARLIKIEPIYDYLFKKNFIEKNERLQKYMAE